MNVPFQLTAQVKCRAEIKTELGLVLGFRIYNMLANSNRVLRTVIQSKGMLHWLRMTDNHRRTILFVWNHSRIFASLEIMCNYSSHEKKIYYPQLFHFFGKNWAGPSISLNLRQQKSDHIQIWTGTSYWAVPSLPSFRGRISRVIV